MKKITEYYTVPIYDEKTFEQISELKTKIPEEIVNQIHISLNNLDNLNWLLSPVMINTNDSSVIFDLFKKGQNGYDKTYSITITEKINNSDFYEKLELSNT